MIYRELVYSNREKLVAALKLRECQINLNSQALEDLNIVSLDSSID